MVELTTEQRPDPVPSDWQAPGTNPCRDPSLAQREPAGAGGFSIQMRALSPVGRPGYADQLAGLAPVQRLERGAAPAAVVQREPTKDEDRLAAHEKSVAKQAAATDKSSWHDLELNLYNSTVAVHGVPGYDYAAGDPSQVGQREKGNQKLERVNSDRGSKEVMIPIGSVFEIGRRVEQFLMKSGGDYSVRILRLYTGHGGWVPIGGLEKTMRQEMLDYGKAKNLNYTDATKVALLQIGQDVLTTARVELLLGAKGANAFNLSWAPAATIELVACQVGNDEDFLYALNRLLSGHQAVLKAAKIDLPGIGGVDQTLEDTEASRPDQVVSTG